MTVSRGGIVALMCLSWVGMYGCGGDGGAKPTAETAGDATASDTNNEMEVFGEDAGGTDGDTLGDTSPDTGSGAGEDASTGGDMAPNISEAGLCELPETFSLSVKPANSPEETDLWRHTLSDPQAVCNDGTPAVLYISPAPTGSPDADKWVVWLEGGGGCNHAKACADRWCDSGHYNAGKMSSHWAPAGIRGQGIFNREPTGGVNLFAGYNLVQVYYCSSDNWIGDAVQKSLDVAEDDYPAYSIRLKGARIVDATVAALQGGISSDGRQVALPSLNDASLVLFAGTSAGGGGARFNADRVGATVKASNPDVDFRLMVDAGFHPKDPHPTLGVTQEISDEKRLLQHDVMTNFRGASAFLDASCVAFHPGEEYMCSDNTHLLVHHVETPWYVKMDLTDTANTPGIFADDDEATDDDQQFTQAVYELVTSLADLPSFREEGGDYVPGVFSSNCGHHVNLEVDAFYAIQVKQKEGSKGLSNHDVLHNWVSGNGPDTAIHQPDGSFTSVCP